MHSGTKEKKIQKYASLRLFENPYFYETSKALYLCTE